MFCKTTSKESFYILTDHCEPDTTWCEMEWTRIGRVHLANQYVHNWIYQDFWHWTLIPLISTVFIQKNNNKTHSISLKVSMTVQDCQMFIQVPPQPLRTWVALTFCSASWHARNKPVRMLEGSYWDFVYTSLQKKNTIGVIRLSEMFNASLINQHVDYA